MECECSTWCMVEPQPITDKHHMACPHYNDTIKVVKITHGGNTLIERNIVEALGCLSEGDEDELYTLEFTQMLEREFDALPEFQGF